MVNTYNEWDTLEEVIVGNVEGASIPIWHVTLKATMPKDQWRFYQEQGGKPFPPEQIQKAEKDLQEFVHILEAEGVTVKRPERIDHNKPYQTPDWESPGGIYAAMPRDVMLVIGDEIIEAPMSWRTRYYEIHAYRNIIKEYFKKGARWTAAPKPQLKEDLYQKDYKEPEREDEQHIQYVITEKEPTFDAADFIRCGRDIFYQKSHVTNEFGIQWLQRHLGDTYRLHQVQVTDSHPMHIDASLMPLAPGKLLINPQRVKTIPPQFRTWDVYEAPSPCIPDHHLLYMTSKWIHMNLLMLDHQRVIVEKNEAPLIALLKKMGLKPIPCHFLNFNTFGGSFHCATMDIRRRGKLETYF